MENGALPWYQRSQEHFCGRAWPLRRETPCPFRASRSPTGLRGRSMSTGGSRMGMSGSIRCDDLFRCLAYRMRDAALNRELSWPSTQLPCCRPQLRHTSAGSASIGPSTSTPVTEGKGRLFKNILPASAFSTSNRQSIARTSRWIASSCRVRSTRVLLKFTGKRQDAA